MMWAGVPPDIRGYEKKVIKEARNFKSNLCFFLPLNFIIFFWATLLNTEKQNLI